MNGDKKEILDALDRELLQNEKKDVLAYRRFWSPRIFWLILSILIFQGLLVIAIGSRRLDFMSYQTVVSVYLGESVVQVFGLGVIVLKFLFPKNHS